MLSNIHSKLVSIISSHKQININILSLLLYVGLLVGAISLIVTSLIAFTLPSIISIGIIIVTCVIGILSINVFHKYVFASFFVNFSINLLLFPFVYFTSGGLHSGSVIWMLIGLVLPFTTIKGKKAPVVAYLINLMGPLASILVGYFHPELVTTLENEAIIVVDILTALFLVSLCFGIVYKYQSFVYNKQRREISESARIANAATEAKTNFLSNMTHDIRTPMNAIIGYTEIARKNADNRATLLSSLSNISVASSHLLSLVNDVLDMSRIESGKFDLQLEPASIKELIDKVVAIMLPEMEDIDIHCQVDTSAVEDDEINCDVLRLTQVLINVLSNAVKYSKPGGRVFITVAQKQNVTIDSIMCEIRIRDEGIGMSKTFLPHVFEPFEREKTSTVSGIVGSGLGLSITKTLVEMMRGTISVKSELGKGSEFIIRIPFEVPTLVEFTPEEVTLDYNFEGRRVLVVEDNDLNLDIVKEILMEYGFEVDLAKDGTYAIEKMRTSTPGYYDAVLMDVQMPLMNGYEATEIIRTFDNKELANIPIIAFTANAYDVDKAKAEKAGMNAFICKPINCYEILKTLDELIK